MRWGKSNSDKCKLWKCRRTTDHCLNICKVGLDTGRWTWRHNNIVNYVVNCLDTQKFSIHSGHEAAGGGSIPPEVCITNLKRDITILDTVNKDSTFSSSHAHSLQTSTNSMTTREKICPFPHRNLPRSPN